MLSGVKTLPRTHRSGGASTPNLGLFVGSELYFYSSGG
jgi:hypothetical protein